MEKCVGITVQMDAYTGIHMIEILMVGSIAVIMDITTTQKKDKVVCHTKDKI